MKASADLINSQIRQIAEMVAKVERMRQWPDEDSDRQKAVEQNGNTAEHYDNVSNPSHYQLMPGVEVKHVREAILNNAPPGIPYNQIDDWSRAWEYITRMWGKNGLEDARKARVYLDWLIEKMEKPNE